MLVHESTVEVATSTGPMRVHVIAPKLPQYPEARFPGVVVFSEIYNVTRPVSRFGQSIASHGFIVAMPTVFHEFEPDAMAYDEPGTDAGNAYKKRKWVSATDSDCAATIDLLVSMPNCTGRIGATGMCYGGHLAFRAAFDPRVLAAVCYFATDIHDDGLGPHGSDSLQRAAEIRGEVAMIFGVHDTHVPLAGRDAIRARCQALGFPFTFLEVQAAHAFIRDESSKGRYDGALTGVCFSLLMELFERTIARDLGPRQGGAPKPEHVC